MRTGSFLSASLLTAALALPFASLAGAAIVVNIDKTTQQMSVSVDGAPRYVWPVSTGRAGYDTPNGTFKVNRMDADHLSQESRQTSQIGAIVLVFPIGCSHALIGSNQVRSNAETPRW